MSREAIIAELKSLAETQLVKYDFVLSGTLAVPNGGSASLILNVEQDADFLIEEMTMALYGPTDVNGIPIAAGAQTNFPTPAVGGPIQVATRGVTCQLQDTGPGRFLIPFQTPCELIATPGYGSQFYIPWKSRYLALRNSKLQFIFQNRDSALNTTPAVLQYHYVEVALHGKKYESYLTAQ